MKSQSKLNFKIDADVARIRSEEDLGLAVFISPHEPFQAVFKQRYTDFVVNEIDKDGNVVHLTDQHLHVEKADTTSELTAAEKKQREKREAREKTIKEAEMKAHFKSLVDVVGMEVALNFAVFTRDEEKKGSRAKRGTSGQEEDENGEKTSFKRSRR